MSGIGFLIATLCVGVAVFLVSFGRTQEVKPTTSSQDDLQSRVEDLANFLGPFVQEGSPGKVVVFDLVGPEGLRAPFGNWLADQISTTLSQRYPALLINRSAISVLLDNRNRDAERESRAGHLVNSKRDRAYAKQAGAEIFIFGSFSKLPRGIRIDFTAIGEPPRSMVFWAILPLTDQVASLMPRGLETKTPKGESDGASSVAEPQCLWCPIRLPAQKASGANCHGTIVLKVLVNQNGRAIDIQNTEGIEGCADQTRAIIEGARRWWFQPVRNLDGKGEPKMATVRVVF